MISRSLRQFSLTLIAVVAIPAGAGTTFYASCPESNLLSGPFTDQLTMQQLEFAKEIGNELKLYSFRGQADIQTLLNWLDSNILTEDDRWPAFPIETLNKDGIAKFFIWDLHVLHQQMRLHLALSSQPKGIGFVPQELENAGNIALTYPVKGPFELTQKRQSPLSKDEIEVARNILIGFWDGQIVGGVKKPGVIDKFIRQMEIKGDLLKQTPSRAEEISDLILRFKQSRNLPTAKERIDRAMHFNDRDWIDFRTAKLYQKQNEHVLELWKIIDRYRPILYLTDVGIQKPSAVYSSLQHSQQDSIAFGKRVDLAKNVLGRFSLKNVKDLTGWTWEAREARANMKWFAGYQWVGETIFKRRPDLCRAANHLRFQINNRELLKTGIIYFGLAAPLVPALSPIVATTGFIAGSASLVWNSYSAYTNNILIYKANTVSGRFGDVPLANQDLELVTSDTVREAREDFILSIFGSAPYVGIPILLSDTIMNLAPVPNQ